MQVTPPSKHTGNLKLQLPFIMYMCAPPRAGKSTLMRFLIRKLAMAGSFHYGWAFSSTMTLNNDYDFMPDGYKSNTFTEEKLARIMQFQADRLQTHPDRCSAFLILDDMVGSLNPNSRIWDKLFTTYRHYKLTVFVAVQYAYKMPPIMRVCATYVIIFRQDNARSYAALFDNFLQDLDNKKAAKLFIDEHTREPFTFIMVKNNEPHASKYSFSKAVVTQPFCLRFG